MRVTLPVYTDPNSMGLPKITIIIPAHNEALYVGGCLDCVIKNCSHIVNEIIVVNNASDDTTASIVMQYPQVTLITETKKGVSFARQAGYKAAHGDILCFMDADTHVTANRINQIINHFEDEKVGFVTGPYSYYDIPIYQQTINTAYRKTFVYWSYLIVGYIGVGGNFAIRKSILDQLGGFDLRIAFYGDDTDIARRSSTISIAKYDRSLVMPTSARRFQGQGLMHTVYVYTINFFSQAFRHKPVTNHYQDFR